MYGGAGEGRPVLATEVAVHIPTNADIVATTTRRDQPTGTRGGRNLTLVPTVRRTRVAVALTERANVTLAGTRGRTVRT